MDFITLRWLRRVERKSTIASRVRYFAPGRTLWSGLFLPLSLLLGSCIFYPYGLRGRVSDLKGELDAALSQIDSVQEPPSGS